MVCFGLFHTSFRSSGSWIWWGFLVGLTNFGHTSQSTCTYLEEMDNYQSSRSFVVHTYYCSQVEIHLESASAGPLRPLIRKPPRSDGRRILGAARSTSSRLIRGWDWCPFMGIGFTPKQICVGDEMSPIVGWCEKLGHWPTPVDLNSQVKLQILEMVG